jgi:hypothetical protein
MKTPAFDGYKPMSHTRFVNQTSKTRPAVSLQTQASMIQKIVEKKIWGVICTLFLGLIPQTVLAEGTKQWSPSSDFSFLKVNTTGQFAFAGYGVAANRRLYIRIQDAANERIYLGLSTMVNENTAADVATAYSFRIVSPTGTVVHGPFTVNGGLPPNLTSYAMSAAGPAPIVGAGGYPVTNPAWVFNPTVAGDYYLEFSTAASIKWFDITVATRSPTPTAINGRVWSQAWVVRANNGVADGAFDTPFNGAFFAYDGNYVTKINFQGAGLRPLEGQFSFNSTGTASTGNKESDRRSVQDVNAGNPQYQAFLNPPNPALYPVMPQGSLQNLPLKVTNPSTPNITVEVTQPGRVELLLDFGGDGSFTAGVDRRLFANVTAGTNTIPWNGQNGAGVVVGLSSYPIPVRIAYTQGEIHFTAYDVEGLDTGFNVFTQTATGTIGPNLQFWDDVNIPDAPGTAPVVKTNVDTGAVKRQTWTNTDYGDLNTINTWWYAYRDYRTTTIVAPGDYGDAPTSYGVAWHDVTTSPALYLGGVAPDLENSNQPGSTALLDDSTGSDDEDSVATFPTLTTISGATYTVSVNVTNTTGSPAYLVGYIDFNRDGDFLDTGERSSTVTVNVSGSQNVSLTTPVGMTAGTTYARFRLSSTQSQAESSVGTASSGEVEDYQLSIAARPTAPLVPISCTPTTLSNATLSTAALEAPISNETLLTYVNAGGSGNTLTIRKLSGTNSAGGTSPNIYQLGSSTPVGGLWLGSDDNVVRPSGPGQRDTETYEAAFSTPVSTLQMTFAAINGNRDGLEYIKVLRVLSSSGTDITASTTLGFQDGTPVANGSLAFFVDTNTLEPTTYNGAVSAGGTYGNSNGTITLINTAGIAKVEFQRLEPGNTGSSHTAPERSNGVTLGPIGFCPVAIDYGDAPDTGTGTGSGNYKTTSSDGGPNHIVFAGLSLGSVVADSDSGALQNAAADADDTNGSPDDEDGVSSFPTLTTTSGATYTVSASVTNTTGSPAYLVGYIDFNRDGDFLDVGEQSATITVSASGSQSVSFTTPAGMTAGTTYARFRLSSTSAEVTSSTGAATSGEVEDYQLTITENAKLGLAKALDRIIPTSNAATNHDYTLVYRLTLENFSTVALSNLELFDDVTTQFSGLNPTDYNTWISVPANAALLSPAADLTLNGTWDGTGSSNILASSQSLAAGATKLVYISFVVTVNPTATAPNNQLRDNSATANGTTPSSTVISDTSTNGTDPDGADGDNNPDESEVTPASFVKLIKEVRNCGDSLSSCSGSYVISETGEPEDYLEYRIRYYNISSQPITTLEVSDALSATTPFQEDTYGITDDFSLLCPDTTTVDLDRSDTAVTTTPVSGAITAFDIDIMAASACNLGSVAPGENGHVLFKVVIP